ncbi:Asp23/Gls24 family envelope stress response protein [Alkaliphilus pronyensis]|uniref:Asp23/Gls24 family envelope stress response protein n=1 Tax=Alkaliphilus pronyensis TaxID=1482732 RepID=A0A6I0FAH7_9FIRM|nr:Asp23/Gls24 family envelope stress response protein [Alkaliphilus pronyensis]KAB3537382.1 Asp23/Gls24 family envelope stress response protein [Alkaliphilus pronyensis]
MEAVQRLDNGEIKIADEVIATIAGLAATDIKGVAGMSGDIVGDIAEILGKRNLSKGVKVDIDEKGAKIDLYLIVEYGTRIPDVAWQTQDKVKASIQNMTNLNVLEVNIHIQGVRFPKEKEEEKKPQNTQNTK